MSCRGIPALVMFFSGVTYAEAQAAPRVLDGVVPVVYEATLMLTVGQTVTIETRNLSQGADPVLHLFGPLGNEVKIDDNGNGGLSARIAHTATLSGPHVVVLRAKNAAGAGRCDLYKNGNISATAIEFGGWRVTYDNIKAGEQLETVRATGGPSVHRLYLLRDDGIRIERRVASGGTAGAVAYRFLAPRASAVLIFGTPINGGSGAARIIRNDAGVSGHDQDQDGLGTELEAVLGTCSARTGVVMQFDCSTIADARDTDGDGIGDGLEVFGRRDMQPHQPLPMWGANPRHKDLFMEVDFMQRGPGETALKMTGQQAREFARYFQDEVDTLSAARAAAHAAILRNPDRKPGIQVHLDTGVQPSNLQEATLYGDWGGHNTVPPVQNADGTWKGADYTQAWRTHMTPARFGLFRYLLPYATGGGQNGPGYACASGLDDTRVLAHECGHALGLWNHSMEPSDGPDVNCKPNYPSLMNYVYLGGTTHGFADGAGRRPLNNALLREWHAVPPSDMEYLHDLQTVFRYNVDFEQGHVDWNRNGFFEPADKLVRAYANYTANKECEYTKENEVRIDGAASSRSPALTRLAQRIYAFYIDSASQQVRYAFSDSAWDCATFNANCGSFQVGGIASDQTLGAVAGIDAATLRNRVVLSAITTDGRLWQRELSLVSNSESWTPWRQIPEAAVAAGEPALASDGTWLLLIYRDSARNVRYRLRGADQDWPPSSLVLWNGQPIKTSDLASPGLTVGSLQLRPPGQPSTYGFYAAFPDAESYLDVWQFDISTGSWMKTNVLDPRMGPVEGRTALAYAPYLSCCNSSGGWSIANAGGAFYLYYITRDGQGNKVAGMMMSHTPRTAQGTQGPQRIGLQSYYQNSWWYANGMDALADYYQSRSLFVLATRADGQVWLRPRSDGELNYEYKNRNDWEHLGRSLCSILRSVGPLAPEPAITCPQ